MKINVNNTDKLQSELDKVNGKANAHTFTALSIQKMTSRITSEFLKNVSKKSLVGHRFLLVSGDEVPRSYGYTRKLNYVEVVVGSGGR